MLSIKLVLLGFIAAGGIAAAAILKPTETSGKLAPYGWLAIEILTIPAIGLCVFYLFGWQLGVAMLFVMRQGLAFIKPQKDSGPRISSKVPKYAFRIALICVVVSGQQEFMRFAVPLALLIVVPTIFDDRFFRGLESQRRHQSLAIKFIVFVYVPVFLLTGELLRRFAGFEAWMWYYSFFAVYGGMLLIMMVVLGIAAGLDSKAEPTR